MKDLVFRKGETNRTWFRSDRFFMVEGEHYFTTREGNDIGPYPTRDAAKRGLTLYIKVMQKNQESGVYASKIAMQGLWASTMYH